MNAVLVGVVEVGQSCFGLIEVYVAGAAEQAGCQGSSIVRNPRQDERRGRVVAHEDRIAVRGGCTQRAPATSQPID